MRKQKEKRKVKILSPPVDYWFLTTIFFAFIFLIFSFLLIRERLFLQEMRVLLDKYKINLNSFSYFNSNLVNSHLKEPTNPSSSTKIIYLQPENFSLNPSLNRF